MNRLELSLYIIIFLLVMAPIVVTIVGIEFVLDPKVEKMCEENNNTIVNISNVQINCTEFLDSS